MLSLAKIGRGREHYHLRAVGADASAYYSERGEVAGRWLSGSATVLGLSGRVVDEALLAVLAGRDPAAANQLVSPPRTGQRMPGIDACFKAPKSVSLLWAFGDRLSIGSRTLDRVVETAHDEAVHEAMSYLESVAARGPCRSAPGGSPAPAPGSSASRRRRGRARPRPLASIVVDEGERGVDWWVSE
jgi:hypothetical protein